MNKMIVAALITTTLMALELSVTAGTNTVAHAREFSIPKHGKLSMTLPATWKHNIRQPPRDLPPTIILTPNEGDDFKTMLTALWSPRNDATFNMSDSVKRMIDSELQMMLPGAVEKTVTVKSFKGVTGTGYYFLVTDKAPRPGEYPHAVRAGIGVGNLLLSVTILARSKDSAGIIETIKALETATQKRKQEANDGARP